MPHWRNSIIGCFLNTGASSILSRARMLMVLFWLVLAMHWPCRVCALQRFTSSLSQRRSELCATALPQFDVVMFAGGANGTGHAFATVDVFHFSTASFSVAALSVPRCFLACTSVRGKALFAGGGQALSAVVFSAAVDIFDGSSGQWTKASLSQARWGLAAAAVESAGLALFAGGWADPAAVSVVDIYHADTNTWTQAALTQARTQLTATSVSTFVLFAGGWTGGSYSKTVDIFNTATSAWSTAQLSVARCCSGATSVGPLAIFGGGGVASAAVDIFDSRTMQWSTAALSVGRAALAATTIGTKALFGGGSSAAVDVFDWQSNTWSTTSLIAAAPDLAGASISNAALFGGRYGTAPSLDIFIDCPPGNVLSPSPANQCTPCSTLGTFPAAIRSCGQCAPGTFNPQPPQSACFACTAGLPVCISV